MKTIRCEVAVLGGGPAGVCAALAAARGGADTVLVNDRPVLGGNSSSEIRVWTRGATGGGSLFAEEMGIWGELKLRGLHDNPSGSVLAWDDILLDAALKEKNLRLMLNMVCTGVKMSGRRIRYAMLASARTQSAARLEADMFIDCTGDGAVGAAAGVPYRTGREGREEWHEPLAQPIGDGHTLGCSLLLQTKRVGRPVPYTPPSYAYSIAQVEALIGRGGRIVTADMQGSDCWWFEYGGELDTIADDQRIYLELKRIATGIFNYIKNSGKFDAEDLELEWMGTLSGKRASRRLEGAYTLVQQDVEENRQMERAVCYGGWFMDSHPAKGIQSAKEECTQLCLHTYGIPLGCMYHPDFPNLLFAGRNISQSYVALTSSRIMNTCALMGQAAGTAAVFCLREGCSPHVLEAERLGELRQRLMADDVLPGRLAWNAAGVRAGASSQLSAAAPPDGTRLSMEEETYLAYPAACGRVRFHVVSDRAATLTAFRRAAPLPSRRVEQGERIEFHLGQGDNTVEVDASGENDYILLRFEPLCGAAILGGRFLPGIQAGTCMEPMPFHPAFEAEREIYAPENVLDGWLRPWNSVHAWAAAGPQAELTLSLEGERTLRGVLLAFDPDLSMELTSSHCAQWNASHHYALRQGMPGQLVRRFSLWAERGAQRVLLAREEENVRRLYRAVFEPVRAERLTLEIEDTYGLPAVVYAVQAEEA